MNNGNPIEEAHPSETSHNTNFSRRRLLRGAIGAAPIVLTLRSGALAAAASCTGARALVVTDSAGKFTNTTSGIVTGDRCVTPYTATDCPTGKISGGTNAGSVAASGSQWQCKRSDGSPIQGQPVAILSSGAVTSLNI